MCMGTQPCISIIFYEGKNFLPTSIDNVVLPEQEFLLKKEFVPRAAIRVESHGEGEKI